jgi:hypothetical protein
MDTSKAGFDSGRRDRFTWSGAITTVEARPSHSLPTVRAFTLSRPLRQAFGYYALC